ncbi:hypothetical protein CDCA_CDCA12G3544 [Cyanidium caldarium]|uniref:TAFII28-like protein domain-containing protein n=1 Tax=Cyanidium caldarium TaxID=2771 RepID=A0AAV9IYZ1_CYACA|nr:hypothetical protein CDCA_CDCA12G3544 [Cyanidium caldarium]
MTPPDAEATPTTNIASPPTSAARSENPSRPPSAPRRGRGGARRGRGRSHTASRGRADAHRVGGTAIASGQTASGADDGGGGGGGAETPTDLGSFAQFTEDVADSAEASADATPSTEVFPPLEPPTASGLDPSPPPLARTPQPPLPPKSFRELTNEQFEQLSEAQKERYIEFRRAAIKPAHMRRLVSALLPGLPSYPTNHSFLVALQGLGKMFVGDLIETAVQVKLEWDAVERRHEQERPPPEEHAMSLEDPLGTPAATDEAPLEPRHIREAYRRLRRHGHLYSVLECGNGHVANVGSAARPSLLH